MIERPLGAAALAALLGLGLPAVAAAQQAPDTAPVQASPVSDTQFSVIQNVIARQARTTQMLASMQNQISSRDISVVPVNNLRWNATQRSMLDSSIAGDGYNALQAALGKATVADVDRNNGQSEDQSSLAEYLQHMGIDPRTVVGVDIRRAGDAQNPHVIVYYRQRANNPAQSTGGAG
ncbi:MAG TPA: hypothetical protein VHT53_12135 [Candidatus Elarobacter sp.]|nr:hypothetical protein [Candidatus Elarobacter sp.]